MLGTPFAPLDTERATEPGQPGSFHFSGPFISRSAQFFRQAPSTGSGAQLGLAERCTASFARQVYIHMAVGQHQWYHFGVGAPPSLVYFSGD